MPPRHGRRSRAEQRRQAARLGDDHVPLRTAHGPGPLLGAHHHDATHARPAAAGHVAVLGLTNMPAVGKVHVERGGWETQALGSGSRSPGSSA